MNAPNPLPAERPAIQNTEAPESGRRRFIGLAVVAMLLIAGFGGELERLLGFAWSSTLYSHIPLIPVVSGWLLWMKRRELPGPGERAAGAAAILAGSGAALALCRVTLRGYLEPETSLALATLAFVLLLAACVAWFIGHRFLRAAVFPLSFLVFMAPLPAGAVDAIENVLQHGSAAVARALFSLSGTSMFYDELTFQLPGISLHVAPECSGIHSTLALLMVSLIAGHLFLRSTFRSTLLTVAVIPLAFLRNGFRIYVIGELCIHRGPQMINSPLHHQGGPLFFSLSLVPFAALLYVLVKRDRRVP